MPSLHWTRYKNIQTSLMSKNPFMYLSRSNDKNSLFENK